MTSRLSIAFMGALMLFVVSGPTAYAEGLDWSGLYVGASLGKRNVNADWETTSYLDPSSNPLAFGTDPTETMNSSSNSISAFVGMNWEVMPQVLAGVEGRLITASNTKKHTTIPGVDPDNPPDYSYVEVDSSLGLDLVGRVGYLVTQDVHVYGSLGLSTLRVDVSATCPADTDFCNPGMGTQHNSESKTLTGWTAGLGIEAAVVDIILVRLEYSYAKYNDFSFGGLPAHPDSYGFASDVGINSNTISLGVAYLF